MEKTFFSDLLPAAENENPRKEDQPVSIFSFERARIDLVREISETGYSTLSFVPKIRQTTVAAPLSMHYCRK